MHCNNASFFGMMSSFQKSFSDRFPTNLKALGKICLSKLKKRLMHNVQHSCSVRNAAQRALSAFSITLNLWDLGLALVWLTIREIFPPIADWKTDSTFQPVFLFHFSLARCWNGFCNTSVALSEGTKQRHPCLVSSFPEAHQRAEISENGSCCLCALNFIYRTKVGNPKQLGW